MTIDYSALLTTEQKKNILEQRLSQFISEAYQHTMNKEVALATSNENGVKAADEALEILDKAISIHQEEIDKLTE